MQYRLTWSWHLVIHNGMVNYIQNPPQFCSLFIEFNPSGIVYTGYLRSAKINDPCMRVKYKPSNITNLSPSSHMD